MIDSTVLDHDEGDGCQVQPWATPDVIAPRIEGRDDGALD